MILKNVPLKEFNTFGIQSIAKRFARFSSQDELKEILKELNDDSLLILGGGSNVLFTKNFDGLVLRNEIKGFEITEESDDSVIVKSGAGEVWHEFVLNCLDHDFGGIENLSLIPGSVGASPMQNIGAYGVEIKDVFHSLEAYEIKTGNVKSFAHEECQFGYRESVFKRTLKDQFIILSVSFKLSKKHKINSSYGAIDSELAERGILNPTIKDISNAVVAIRSSKLPNPKEIGNAGSFFKNPVVDLAVLSAIEKNYENVPNYSAGEGRVKLAAGWLIEQAGWKGKTISTYGVHKNQALVLVNYSDSLGSDIFELSTSIINDISSKFGVELEREVNIL